MFILVLIALFFIIYYDIYILKKQDKDLFLEIFKISKTFAIIFSVLMVISAIVFEQKTGILVLFIIGFFMPLYLYKRSQLIKLLRGSSLEDFQEEDKRKILVILSDALGIVIVWFFCAIVFTASLRGFYKIFPQFNSELGELVILAILSSTLIIVLIRKASGKFSNQGFWVNVGFTKKKESFFKVVLIPAFIGLFFSYVSALIATERQIQPQTPLGDVIGTADSPLLLSAFMFLALIVAPLVEEIVFRGYFFHVIRKVKGDLFAIYFISLTFAFLHVGQYWGDWLAILMVTILGFTLTLLRYWAKTTTASVVTHYIYNAGVSIIPVIMIALSNPAFYRYKAYYPYLEINEKEELLLKSIEKDPNLADAYNDLAWLYAQEEKKLKEALVLINKALTYDEKRVAYLDTKAKVLERLKRYDESIALRKQLLKREMSNEMRDYQKKELEVTIKENSESNDL